LRGGDWGKPKSEFLGYEPHYEVAADEGGGKAGSFQSGSWWAGEIFRGSGTLQAALLPRRRPCWWFMGPMWVVSRIAAIQTTYSGQLMFDPPASITR